MKHPRRALSFNKIVSSVVFVFVALGISFYFFGNQNSLLTQVVGTGTITTVTTKPALLNFESSLSTPVPAFARYCANATTFLRTTSGPKTGNFAFKFSGTDDCSTANSFVYYKIADANIPITENTVLEYKIAPQSTLGRNVGVDLLLDNGQYLRDQDIYSDDAVLMHPAYQSNHTSFSPCCPVATLVTIKVNLGKIRGRAIKQIIVAYDDASPSQVGTFDARIDDIKIYDVAPFRTFALSQTVVSIASQYITKDLSTGVLASAIEQQSFEQGTVIDGPISTSYLKDTAGVNIPKSNVLWRIDFTSNLLAGSSDTSAIDGWIRENYLQSNTPAQVSSAIFASTNTCNKIIKGDVDCSGDVTVTDGVVTLKCAAGMAPCDNPSTLDIDILQKEDMDCNGKITVTDGVNILRKAAGLSVPACNPLVNTNLTCNTVWDTRLSTTDSWTVAGTNVSVRYGANRNFGGIGVELTLINPSSPANAVNVIEARSAAGAGWQTSYWGRDAVTNLVTIMNQAAGNNVGSQWGYNNSFSGMAETYWNPVTSDKYYPTGNFNDPSVGSSPCNNTGYTFDDGRLSLALSKRGTSAGTAISIRNEYTLRARVNQNYKKWVLGQGPYFDKKVAQDHNLRVYFHGRSGWNEGPILPWKDFNVEHGQGSCSATGCEYTISGNDVDRAVAVWNIGGRDIGLAYAVDTSSTLVFYNEKTTYCGDAANPLCGNIALGQYLVYNTTGYQVSAGSERTFGVDYSIGTSDELHALGFQF